MSWVRSHTQTIKQIVSVSQGTKIYTYNKTVKKLCLYIEYIKKIIIEGGLETVIEHESKKKILSVCLFVCTR